MVLAATLIVVASCAGAGLRDRERTSAPRTTPADAPRQAWRWDAPPSGSVGMPASDGHSVAFTYGHLGLVLLEGEGREAWRALRPGLRPTAPLLTPTLVAAATEDGVVAYRRADGHERWHAALGERANSPVEISGVMVVTTWEGSVIGLDLEDGAVLWRISLGGVALAPPVGEGFTAVATWEAEGGEAAGILAVDSRTGARQWDRPLAPGGVSGPGAGSGRVVVIAGDRAVRALALDDGRPLWHVRTEDSGSAEVPPLTTGGDGGVVAAHRLGGLVRVDAAGAVGWSASSDGAAVRGGPAGPGRRGRYALPLDDGRLLLGGPHGSEVLDPPGLVSGVALGPGGALLVATAGRDRNHLYAISGW